jgi:hypothetical protein
MSHASYYSKKSTFFPQNVLVNFNPLNAELNPICYLLALLGARLILHVGRIRVKWIAEQTVIISLYCTN